MKKSVTILAMLILNTLSYYATVHVVSVNQSINSSSGTTSMLIDINNDGMNDFELFCSNYSDNVFPNYSYAEISSASGLSYYAASIVGSTVWLSGDGAGINSDTAFYSWNFWSNTAKLQFCG